MDQASMPPATLYTSVKPCLRKCWAATWLRPPVWQMKAIGVSVDQYARIPRQCGRITRNVNDPSWTEFVHAFDHLHGT